MSLIKILPDHLINQIAAGEVVERPASVVKELVENAVDADANYIEINCSNAGKEEIQVIDNGNGMSREDALMAFKPHSTSKIENMEDLTRIKTMGFRGEALASISAVSKVTLETRTQQSEIGTKIRLMGETIEESSECGTAHGTSIRVRDLFFNTPARKKYLKSDATELQHITGVVTETALSFPYIHFKYSHNGRVIFAPPRSDGILDRVRLLMGKDISDHLIPIFFGGKEFSIEGFIGKPDIARNSRTNNQYLFVNNRSIRNNALSYAVSEGFHSLLPRGKYPVFFLYLTIDPEKIDVNVHPRKLEVRFQNQEEIFSIVKKAAKTSLETHVLAPKIIFAEKNFAERNMHLDGILEAEIKPNSKILKVAQNEHSEDQHLARSANEHFSRPASEQSTPYDDSLSQHNASVAEALAFTEDFIKGTREIENRLKGKQQSFTGEESLIPIAQVAASYIIAREHQGIVIIDQHAAHERYMYEKFMKMLEEKENKKTISQPLLVPFTLELSHREVQILEENRDILEKLGFEIESSSGNKLNVNAIPACLNEDDLKEVLTGVIGDLMKYEAGKSIRDKQEKVLTSMACKSAIKFGRSLTHDEQVALIHDLERLDQKYTCPHGRPTMIRLSFDELEKRFGRK